jgi:hypothetical protein
MINHFAAFDMPNYGDLLYAIIFEKMIKIHNSKTEIKRFSFLGGEAPQNAGYRTHRIKELLFSSKNLSSHLLIGGGDVLQEDGLWLADNYKSRYRSHIKNSFLFQSNFLLTKLFKKKPLNIQSLFYERELNYPSIGPFIIDPDNFPSIKSVTYCSCGVPYKFKRKDEIALAFNKANFIYVRDKISASKLIEVGVDREIYVAPDIIVTLSDFFDKATEAEKGRKILHKFGVDTNQNILCFQSFLQSKQNKKEILNELKLYQKRTQDEVILMPIGYCHSDHVYLQELAKESEGILKYIEVYSIFDMLSVIAASNIFLGTSMHGNITAFSFGIPHIFGFTPYDKAKGFLDIVNLPADFRLNSWAEINEKLEMIDTLGMNYFGERSVVAKQKIHDTFDLLVNYLTN